MRRRNSGFSAERIYMIKDNTSGYKGVSCDKKRKKWKAFLYHKNKLVDKKYFDTKEDAILYREKLEKRIDKDC